MQITFPQAFFFVTAAALLCGSRTATAQNPDPVRFAAPKRIKAGDKFLGEGRLYPSPVLHDVNGDGKPDVVIGDLFGKITVACREATQPSVVLGSEKPLKDRSGEQLKFHNW